MRRHTVLTGLLVAAVLLSAFVLSEVLLTVFFGFTVAYVALPLYRRLRRYGVQRHVASGLTTAAVFVVALAVAMPMVLVLYLRREDIQDGVEALPSELSFEAAGFTYVVQAGEVWDFAAAQLQSIGLAVVNATPQLLMEFLLFTVVVFGLLLGWTRAATAVRAVVPFEYHDVLESLHRRVRDTLRAIYLVQLATAVATFAVSLVVFYVLGYEFVVTLAVLSGVLQFMPIVGPSVVLAALAAVHLAAGDLPSAALVLVVGGVFVAAIPDMLVRPYLAGSLADVPATLYFVGFFGGVLTIGIYGAIAGPLVLAVLVEAVSLLGAELGARREERMGATK